jgi:methyl-accepting chemotaxis protein
MSYLRAHLRAKLMLLVSLPLLAGGLLTLWLLAQQSAEVDRYASLARGASTLERTGIDARQEATYRAEMAQMERRARRQQWILLVGALAFGATVLAFTHATAERILRPIQALEDGLARMRSGDLSVRLDVHGEDETARMTHAFNAMGHQLSGLVQRLQCAAKRVAEGAGGLSSHAGQMNGAAQELAKNVIAQRRTTEHSAAAVFQLSASVEQVRASLAVARSESQRAQELAASGRTLGKEVRDAMDEASLRAQRLAKGAAGLKELLHQALTLVKEGRTPEPARLEDALDRCAQASGNAAVLATQNAQALARGEALVVGMVDAMEGIHEALRRTGRQAEEISRAADDQSAVSQDVAGRVNETSRSIGEVQLAAAQLANTGPELALTAKELAEVAITLERSSEAFTLV